MKNYLLLFGALLLLCLGCQNDDLHQLEENNLYEQVTHDPAFEALVDIRQKEMCIMAETDRIMKKEMFVASEKGSDEAVQAYMTKYETALNEMDAAINDRLLSYLDSEQDDKEKVTAITDIQKIIGLTQLSEEMKSVQIAYHKLLIEGNEGNERQKLFETYPELKEDKTLLTNIFLEYVQTAELSTCIEIKNIPGLAKK